MDDRDDRCACDLESYESFQSLGFEYDYHRERLTPMLRDCLTRAADVTTDAYRNACAKAEAAKAALLTWFDGIDAVLAERRNAYFRSCLAMKS